MKPPRPLPGSSIEQSWGSRVTIEEKMTFAIPNDTRQYRAFACFAGEREAYVISTIIGTL